MKLYHLDSENVDPRYCYIDAGLSVGTNIEVGIPALLRMAELEEDVLDLEMDEDNGGLELSDYVSNDNNLLPLRRGCAEAFAKDFELGPHELLPARLINEKERVHSDDYVIVNLIGRLECLDTDRSDMDGDPDHPAVIIMGKWYLRADQIPPRRDLFRVKGVLGYVFSERLVAFIQSQGYTNFEFLPVSLS